ncbi:MAG: LysM peptidoglycan-binding domain-containing protein [Saprospiraceae bacterium]|nr:LysM peptidoglycan-binding domain-containing protein [Saprospiraceae bacterium]
MFRKLTYIGVFLGMAFSAQSQEPAQPLDTSKYLANQFIVHKVEPGQTLFTIARTFDLKPDEVRTLNASVPEDAGISPGQILRIPITKEASPGLQDKLSKMNKEPILHKVQPKEGLFAIYRAYGPKVAQLKAWNNLEDEALKIDQELIVGWRYNSIGVPATVGQEKSVFTLTNPDGNRPVIRKQEAHRQRFLAEGDGKSISTNKGVAIWFDADNRMMSANYYALYSGAERGSIVEVMNPDNGRKVYVKVIGSLPDTGENTGAMIKLTEASKKVLGALGAKTRIEVNSFK